MMTDISMLTEADVEAELKSLAAKSQTMTSGTIGRCTDRLCAEYDPCVTATKFPRPPFHTSFVKTALTNG